MLPSGITSFQALQGVLKQRERGRLVYFVFDLLREACRMGLEGFRTDYVGDLCRSRGTARIA